MENTEDTVPLKACIHPRERSRYWLAILVVLPVILLYLILTYGFGLLIVPILLIMSWITVRIVRAHFLCNSVEVTKTSFPQVHKQIETI